MAANDEFPRGIEIPSAVVGGGGNSVSFPATPGIAWILTGITIDMLVAAAVSAFHFNIYVNGQQWGWMGSDSTDTGGGTNEYTWTGAKSFPENTVVNISLDNSTANVFTLIKATAEPI